MSVISAAQMGAAARNTGHAGLSDDKSALGDPLGGWQGGATPDSLSGVNTSSAQRVFAFRAPDHAGIGVNTVGTWQGTGQAWHDRYKSD